MSAVHVLLEQDGKWVVSQTIAARPILIDCAKKQKQVTYRELNIAVAKKLGEPPINNYSSYHMV